MENTLENEILTIEEVAAYLRVSERTVYDWAQKGEIPCGKLGTSWRFKRDEITGWVQKKLSPRIDASTAISTPFGKILSQERTLLFTKPDKVGALNELVDVCASLPGVRSRKQLIDAILERESLMSTGIGLGVGVPHA
jgi:PTS system nitrogen regulatory IIA component